MQARSGGSSRRRIDRLLFLGPATLLLVLFFLAPVHRQSRHRLHRHGAQSPGDASSPPRTSLRVLSRRSAAGQRHRHDARLRACTLAIFNVGYALLLALAHHRAAAADRRLLPRRLAAAADEPVGGLCAALELGRGADRLRAAQPGAHRPRPAARRHEERRADAADRPGQRLHRRLVRHDHLHQRHPLDPASICSMRRGSTEPASLPSSATSRCRRSAGSSASSRSTRRSRCWSASSTSG